MDITYNEQTIDFFGFKERPSQVLLYLSGGIDSASILYLLCKHFPEIEVITICARDVNAPHNGDAAQKILKTVRGIFPKGRLPDLIMRDFDDRDETFYPVCRQVIQAVPKYAKLDECQVSKILQIDKIAEEMRQKFPSAVRTDGMTMNPPVQVMKELGFYQRAEKRRDPTGEKLRQMPGTVYHPYINVDKKFVADIYHQNGLMESIFPLTVSCTGREDVTENYTKECHRCFWCHEKKWAFNLSWEEEV